MKKEFLISSIWRGILASGILLAVFFGIVTAVSGFEFALNQFYSFWYFLISLSVGFGIQIGLYSYLKKATQAHCSVGTMAVTGTTSTLSMVSCCTHYLVNIVPLLGIGVFASFIGQYQKEFFWVGIVFNLAGISYIAYKLNQFLHEKNEMDPSSPDDGHSSRGM